MKKKCLITGIGGQDGSYLAEHLLSQGYGVYGIVRRNSTPEHQQSRLDGIRGDINVSYGDVLDESGLHKLMKQSRFYGRKCFKKYRKQLID